MNYRPDFREEPKSEKALLEQRAALFADAEALVELAEKERRDLTPTESRSWYRMANEVDKISAQLQTIHNENTLYNAGKPDKSKGNPAVLGDLMKAAFAFSNNTATADQRRDFDYSSGGAVIQDPKISALFFSSFKANNPLIDLGAQILTSPNYTSFPVQTSDPVVTWFVEGGSAIVPDTGATIAGEKVEYKIPAILTLASNFWLTDSTRLGSEIIGRMLVSTLQETVIKAVLNGVAANNQPTGLDNISGVQSEDAAGAALADYTHFTAAVAKLLSANVALERIGGIIGTNTWLQLQNLVSTGDGQPLMMPAGLRDVPMYVTSAVREDYGEDEDLTKAYLGDFSNLLIAMHSSPVIQPLRDKYADTFQTGFLAHMRFDVRAVRPNTFCRIDDILV